MRSGTFTAWTLRLLVVASTTILVGLIWDISWHMTIGRDTFWTPAHLFIYIGGAISGCACGALAIHTTFFAAAAERRACTNLWGGFAPLGAWISIWGAIAMIASGPFDDWWHNAYGLDVKIISPPHIMLFAGMISIVFGALILALHQQNANQPVLPTTQTVGASSLTLSYVAGVILTFLSILFFSEGYPNHQHSTAYYFLFSCVYPGVLVATARAARASWAASKAALSYMAIELAMIWILPRFAATPKLGPVLNPVGHMVPSYFPHLLIVPALGIDWVVQTGVLRGWKNWLVVPLCAGIFAGLFMMTQWTFSGFLLSPAAHNAIFVGGQNAPYYAMHREARDIFWEPQSLLALHSLAKVFSASLASVIIGWSVGSWMRKVRR